MLAKLATLILAGAMTGAGVLVVRQQRLMAVHEMATSIERSAELDRKLWRFRSDLAAQLTPSKVRRALEPFGEFTPIPLYWCPPDVPEQLDPPVFIGSGHREQRPDAPRLAVRPGKPPASRPVPPARPAVQLAMAPRESGSAHP